MEPEEINEFVEGLEKGGEAKLYAVSFSISVLAVLVALATVEICESDVELLHKRVHFGIEFAAANSEDPKAAAVIGDASVLSPHLVDLVAEVRDLLLRGSDLLFQRFNKHRAHVHLACGASSEKNLRQKRLIYAQCSIIAG